MKKFKTYVLLLTITKCLYVNSSEKQLLEVDSIKKTEKYKIFTFIQKIHQHAEDIASHLKDKYCTFIKNGRQDWPGSNPSKYQTKRGLFITIGTYPHSLWTPWGEVKLYGHGHGNTSKFILATKLLFEKMEVKFYGNCESMFGKEKVSFYEAQENSPAETFKLKKINSEEYKQAKGTNKIIITDCGGCSIYEIMSLDGIRLESPELLPDIEYKESKAVHSEWEAIEKIYHSDETCSQKHQ
ncbi:MAG: hypothetical protein ACOYT8_06165 [Candidatus Dependentiae bacterium]